MKYKKADPIEKIIAPADTWVGLEVGRGKQNPDVLAFRAIGLGNEYMAVSKGRGGAVHKNDLREFIEALSQFADQLGV